MKIRKKMK